MLIVCPHCASSYDIDRGAIATHGRRMRCAVCRTLWFVAAEPLTPPVLPRVSARSRLDRAVRVLSIVLMGSFGGLTGFAMTGEWIGGIKTAPAPIVEFAVRNSAGEEVARWTDRSGPPKLSAGETVPFRSRFLVPGGDAREILARYIGFAPAPRDAEGSE